MRKRKVVREESESEFEDDTPNKKILESKAQAKLKGNSPSDGSNRLSKSKKVEVVEIVEEIKDDESKKVGKSIEKLEKTPKKKNTPEKLSRVEELVETRVKSVEEYTTDLKVIEEKIKPRIPLSNSVLNSLKKMRLELVDLSDEIVVEVLQQLFNQTIASYDFDITKKDKTWIDAHSLILKIDKIMMSHENSHSEDMKVMSELFKARTERTANAKREEEVHDKAWKDLPSKTEKMQLKIFISKWGPLKGKAEYSEWKSLEKFRNATKSSLTSLKNNSIVGDDEDDLLNASLL